MITDEYEASWAVVDSDTIATRNQKLIAYAQKHGQADAVAQVHATDPPRSPETVRVWLLLTIGPPPSRSCSPALRTYRSTTPDLARIPEATRSAGPFSSPGRTSMVDDLGTVYRRAAAGFPRTINGGSWSGGCAAFVKNVVPFARGFARALLAAEAAGAKLISDYPGATRGSLNPGRAVGWLAYFGGVPDGGVYDGHVAIIYPDNEILGGSHVMAAYGRNLGWDIGLIDLDYYVHLTGLPYLGCGPWDGQTIPLGSFAGNGVSPIDKAPSIRKILLLGGR